MATMIIRDDALWAKHIEGDPVLAQRIRGLSPNDAIVLRVAGRPIRFRKMRDGQDGRPTDGVKPDPDFLNIWRDLQACRGTTVTVEPETGPDPYLLSLSATLNEWNSPEDAAAYDGL
jgi:hypothetical protein